MRAIPNWPRTPMPQHHLSDTLDQLARRQALRWLAASAVVPLTPLALSACGGGSGDTATSTSTSTSTGTSTSTSSGSTTPTTTGTSGSTTSTTPASCTAQPQETAGPYPADGSQASNQRLNVLTQSGVVRQDIRSSLGGGNTATGVPLTITLQLVNTKNACAPLAGYAVYLWHCTKDGAYSLYSTGITNETYLRGVQQADANGLLTFTTIVPGCYDGRYPHMHFEVYPTLASAVAATNALLTSQLTFQTSMLEAVYATSAYATSLTNYRRISLATDNIFSDDNGASQIATVNGSVSAGYTANLVVGLAV